MTAASAERGVGEPAELRERVGVRGAAACKGVEWPHGTASVEPRVVVEVSYAETLLERPRDPVLRSCTGQRHEAIRAMSRYAVLRLFFARFRRSSSSAISSSRSGGCQSSSSISFSRMPLMAG